MKLSMVLFTLASQTQAMRVCMFMCPMNLEEVCGTDGQTYGKILLKSRSKQSVTFLTMMLGRLVILT